MCIFFKFQGGVFFLNLEYREMRFISLVCFFDFLENPPKSMSIISQLLTLKSKSIIYIYVYGMCVCIIHTAKQKGKSRPRKNDRSISQKRVKNQCQFCFIFIIGSIIIITIIIIIQLLRRCLFLLSRCLTHFCCSFAK